MDVTGWILAYAFGDRKGSNKDAIPRNQHFISIRGESVLCVKGDGWTKYYLVSSNQ